MPVLYGVFLYMGVSSLKGIQVCLLSVSVSVGFISLSVTASDVLSILQLFDRIKLFGMPAKHQPDLIYLRYVPLWKVHVFTVVQLSCLIVLWTIKASAAAVVFPMMVRRTEMTEFYSYSKATTPLFLLSAAGSGSGFHPEASGFLLHQERAELAGRPDTGEQEEEGRRQEEAREGGEL